MNVFSRLGALAFGAASLALPAAALANIQITEWMYSGNGGEYIEFTNQGSTAIDFAGWVYDDDSRFSTVAAGGFDVSAFGIVGAGESVILTEDAAADFAADWSLAPTVKVVGGYTNNIGRNDEINLFDAGGVLIDRFAYGDENFPGTVRTQGRSGTPTSLAALVPLNVTTDWVLAAAGDAYGSVVSANGDIGNPGSFAFAVPEPSTYALLLLGLGVVAAAARRQGRSA